MVNFVFFAQTTQDGDGVFHRRLAYEHRLESPLQRGILLDVFAILVERRGANRTQFAAGQRRLQHVGSIDCAFGSACADQGVQLVDKQNDLSLRLLNLFQYGLEAVFKLAAIFRTRQHRAQIKRNNALVL